MEDRVRFFDALYGGLEKGEFIEVRAVPSQTRRRASGGKWFCPNVYSAVQATARARKGCEVYFGVATRDEQRSLARIPCVWAELDGKAGPDEPEARLKKSPLPPSAVVRSGWSLQAYWFFDEPAAGAEHARVEGINKAIAGALEGEAIHDAVHVLRPPGTYIRRPGGVIEVELLGLWPDRRYPVEELEAGFKITEPEPIAVEPAQPGSARVSDPADEVTEGLQGGCGVGRPTHIIEDLDAYASGQQFVPKHTHTTAAGLAFRPVSEWAARETPPSEFVVEGLVPLRGVTLVTGEGGIGKSFLLMDLAMSVAAGQPFLETFACRQGPALIVDLENDENSIARRTQKLMRARGVADLPLLIARKDGFSDAELAIDKEDSLAALTASLEVARPAVLIIDPLTAAHSKDENDNIAMRAVVRTLSRLAQRFEMAVIVAHHPRKRGQNNDAGQMIRGASDLRNSVDSHIFLRRIDGSRLLIEHDKSRHAPALEKFQVEMTDSADGESIRFTHQGPAPEAAVKSAEARAFVLGVLEEGECKRKELLARGVAAGLNERGIQRALEILALEGVVGKPSYGVYSLSSSEAVLKG